MFIPKSTHISICLLFQLFLIGHEILNVKTSWVYFFSGAVTVLWFWSRRRMVSITHRFRILLSDVYSKDIFLSHALPVRRNAKESGRELSWLRWPELTTGTLHTTEHHAQCANWGELPGRETKQGLGMGWWVVIALCITCFFPFFLPLFLFISFLLLLYFYLSFIIKLFFISTYEF